MRISMICCPFQTSSGFYGSALGAAIERRTGVPVQWVATNCGCGDPQEANRVFQASNPDYFEMPVPADFQSRYAWRRKVRGLARSIVFSAKARRFCGLSRGADVVHFQQILNAYGSKTVFACALHRDPVGHGFLRWAQADVEQGPRHAARGHGHAEAAHGSADAGPLDSWLLRPPHAC